MKSMISLLFLVVGSLASPAFQAFSLQNDGSYKFGYDTSKETGSHSRYEVKGPDGLVIGKFSYEDPTGDLRIVNYQAGDFGYVAKGAVGVAGAPESQFPADADMVSGEGKDNQEEASKIDEQKGEEAKSSDNEDDDAKAMKLQIPSEDGVPEGFPLGFFDQGFHGLRRLPEPNKEESEEDKKDKENGEKSSSDKDEDKGDGTKHHSPLEYFPALLPFSNFHPHTWSAPFYHSANTQLLPFYNSANQQPSTFYQHSANSQPSTSYFQSANSQPSTSYFQSANSQPSSFYHHTANSQQHPVYVYSYQAPQAHGYYYYY